MADVSGLIVSGVNFNFFCFVHNHGFRFLQIWCPIVFASSGHRVLLEFGHHDTLSYKVIKNVQHCLTSRQQQRAREREGERERERRERGRGTDRERESFTRV